MINIQDLLTEIETVGGPENINWSEHDISTADLGTENIRSYWHKQIHKNRKPVWFSIRTGGVNLSRALLRYAIVRDATLDHADFSYAQLAKVVLERSVLESADFEGAELVDADFTNCHLRNANFEGADCEGINFEGADLRLANLTGVNLLTSKNLEGVRWSEAILERTRLRRDQLGAEIGDQATGDWEEARRAYLALKNNFKTIGQYEDASWAYTKERDMERVTHKPRFAKRYHAHEVSSLPIDGFRKRLTLFKFYFRHSIKYLVDTLYKYSCNFGESVGRIIFWTAVLIIGYAFLYGIFSSVGACGIPTYSAFDLLVYSLAATVSANVNGIETLNNWGKFLTASEGVLGIAAFGLVMFVLGNRINRDA